jgi:hypothetical protein
VFVGNGIGVEACVEIQAEVGLIVIVVVGRKRNEGLDSDVCVLLGIPVCVVVLHATRAMHRIQITIE